jgi:hypothetical protein
VDFYFKRTKSTVRILLLMNFNNWVPLISKKKLFQLFNLFLLQMVLLKLEMIPANIKILTQKIVIQINLSPLN